MKRHQRKKMMEEFYKDIEDDSLLPEIKEINIRYCESSETFLINNRWRQYDSVQDVFNECVNNFLKKKIDDDISVKVKPIDETKKIKQITIVAEKSKTIEEKTVKVNVDKTMNPSFAKKQSKYLEGTLQLRNLDEEMFEALKTELDVSEKKFCHVTEIREKKQSVDIDMTCQHEIERIAREMQKKFGGTLKLDYKLHTRDHQTQKELFRLAATVIFPTVKKGQIINYKSKACLIKSIDKKISAINLNDGSKEFIELDEKYEKLERKEAVVSQINPKIKVLDPETFQEEFVVFQDKDIKRKKRIKINDKIPVVKLKKIYFVQ